MRRFQSRVYSVAYHYMRDADEARDVAQDIFVRVYQRLDAYDGTSAFIASTQCSACEFQFVEMNTASGLVSLNILRYSFGPPK